MLTIKIIPNIFEKKGREIRNPQYVPNKPLREYLPKDFDLTGKKIIIDGKIETSADIVPARNSEIILTPKIEGDSGAWGLISGILTVAGLFTGGLTTLLGGLLFGAGVGAGLVASNMRRIEVENAMRQMNNGTASNGNFDSSSPTYGWDGIQTVQDVGIPVPIIYGKHKVGGNIVNMQTESARAWEYVTGTASYSIITQALYINTIRIDSYTINSIKFRVKANTYQINATPGTSLLYTIYYSKYLIEYSVKGSGAWTTAGYVGGGKKSEHCHNAIKNYYYDIPYGTQVDYFDVQLGSLTPGNYDVRVTQTEGNNPNEFYLTTITAGIKTPSSTEPDRQVLNVLLSLAEGEIQGIENIKINSNPIGNYEEIEVHKRFGTNSQSAIPEFSKLSNLYSVGVQLNQNVPYIYTTVDPDVEGFEITFLLPNGLYQTNSKTGALDSWSVDYKVEYKLTSDSSYTDLGTYTLSYKTRSSIRKIFKHVGLTAGKYDIRITRTSTAGTLSQMDDLYLSIINEQKNDNLIYPNTALLGLRMLAQEHLGGGIPNITCDIQGRKVSIPDVRYGGVEIDWADYYWDPDASAFKRLSDNGACTWDGATYITRWSANPIWCIKDLLLNTRFGLGQHIASDKINDAEFLAMAKYCDEKVDDGNGGYEKRFQLNVVIDSPGSALDILNQLFSTITGYLVYSGGTIKPVIDREATAVQVFGMGNIVENSLEMGWKSVKEIPNMVEVQFLNADNDYEQETIAIVDETAIQAGDPLRKKQIRAFVTKTSEAIRFGRYHLYAGMYIKRTISFRAGIDAVTCQAGDLISVSHDVPQWGFSGRVKTGSTTTKVKLDRSVTIVGGSTYKLALRLNGTDTIEERTVTDGAGTYTELNVSVAFSATPTAYDLFLFGVSGTTKKDWRVVAIQRESQGEVRITGIEYNASVFSDTAVVLPTPSYSALRPELPYVTDLILNEELIKLADGTIEDAINVYFTPPVNEDYFVKKYNRARIYWSDDDGVSWVYAGESTTNYFRIIGGIRDLKTYTVAVVSVGEKGEQSDVLTSPQADIALIGKSAPPADVQGFSVKQDGDDLALEWGPNSDVDLFGYEIREGDNWTEGLIVATDIINNQYRVPVFAFGEKRYMIKAIDTSGNYSQTEAVFTFESTGAISIEDLLDGALDSWDLGELVATSQTAVDVTDNAGDNIETASGDSIIISDAVIGFEKITEISDEPVTADAGETITTEAGDVITTTLTADPYLSLKDFGDVYADEGQYKAPIVDLGLKLTYRLTLLIAYEGVNCTYKLEIRTSDDNSTWSAWAVFAPGEYTSRYFQARVTLINDDTRKGGKLFHFDYYATVRYIQDGGQDVSVTSTKDIAFTKTYYSKVNIYVIAEGTNYARITAKSLTGFTVAVRRDSDGALTTGDVDWRAVGY